MTDLVDGRAAPAPSADDDAPHAEVDEVPEIDGARPPAAWSGRLSSAVDWLQRRTLPQILLTAAVVGYTVYFSVRSLAIHHAFGTASYDSALYDQGLWLLSQGEAPFVTLMGRNLFGDHTSFILIFLVPFYWVAPGAGILFISQSAVLAAGAIPIFLYGRRRLESEWLALAPAVAYLLHPAIGWTNLENFHPDAFLGVLVGFAIYGALERKWVLYAVAVVLALSVKEDVVLVMVPLGIWVTLRRDRRIGLLTIGGAVAFALVALFVVMRGLIGMPTRNGWRIPFGGVGGLVDTAVTNPTQLADHLTSDERPWYLWQLTAPFAWLFFRLPSVAMIGGLVMFTNILSTYWYQYQIRYHYSVVIVPALAMGSVYAIGAIRDRWDPTSGPFAGFSVPLRSVAVIVLATSSFVTATLWAPMPWSRDPGWIPPASSPWVDNAQLLMDQIPDDAVVSAHYRITPHIAYREEIYQFPTPFRSVLYGPEGLLDGPRLPERSERVEFVMLPTANDFPVADWLVIRPAFTLVDRNAHWELWIRDPSVELPEP
ncbi:MAG: DUF2079 domain-containing protein [Actinomycetota bacterium]